jgi:hypothetical protein
MALLIAANRCGAQVRQPIVRARRRGSDAKRVSTDGSLFLKPASAWKVEPSSFFGSTFVVFMGRG